MRILIVDVNFEYKNPMYRQFYMSLLNLMEIDFFGPGYVSRECLEKGLCWYLSKGEKVDAILLGNYFLYSSKMKHLKYTTYSLHRNTIPYYKVNDAYQCCNKILEELIWMKDVIKIFIYYEDFMSMPLGDKNMCQKLIENNFYILSWPSEYMQKYKHQLIKQYSYLTNYAYEIAEQYLECYIPIPIHAIGYHEIFVRNFKDRDYTWCVPGNKKKQYYPERSIVQEMIKKNSLKIWDDDPFQTLSVASIDNKHMEWYQFRSETEKFLSWLWKKEVYISSYPKMQYIAASREQYLESMRSTRLVYVEGSVGNCVVRKYFEACACGAVLVAKRAPGMREMGFIHGENCIIVDQYEEIVHIDEMYSETELMQMAEKGQRLIAKKHMFINRAESLLKTLETIRQGRYKGAFWENGNYIIK